MGICILGMGDCNTSITNTTNTVNNTLSENIKQTMMSMTSNMSVFAKASQSYQMGTINAVGCSLDFGPINQDMQVTTDFKQMTKVITKDKYDQAMTSAIDSAVKSNSDVTSGFMSNGANVNNTTNNYNTNINKVLNSFSYSSFQSLVQQMDQSQNVGFSGMNLVCTEKTPINPTCGAHICMGGITQNMVVTLIASQIADTMTSTIMDLAIEGATKASQDNSTTVTSTGMFQDLGNAISGIVGSIGSAIGTMFSIPIIITGLILVAIVVMVLAWKYFSGSSSEKIPVDQNINQGMIVDQNVSMEMPVEQNMDMPVEQNMDMNEVPPAYDAPLPYEVAELSIN